MNRSCLAIILAAGEGTRMRSTLPKVLHRIAGRSMLAHVLAEVQEAGADRLVVVVGPDHDRVAAEALKVAPHAEIVVQKERLGTAHAVLAAKEALKQPVDDVVVAFADTPLITADVFSDLRKPLASGAAVSVLGFEAENPFGYGRLLVEDEKLVAIREEKEASDQEKAVRLCNAGLMAFQGEGLLDILNAIGNDNAKGEFYLTDAVSIAAAAGKLASAVYADEETVKGVNDKVQLASAEATMQQRLRNRALVAGVTMTAPETVFLSFDTCFGKDVEIEPNVFFAPGVSVGDGVTIHAYSHLEGATIKNNVSVGPFARLRPGAVLGEKAKVGNFVEIKKTELGEGAKVSHLTYLGDATIGSDVNIGAGTITCNYDGYDKFQTVIRDGAFIGSNSSLVAPVVVGQGAFVGSGSVITGDVPDNALAIARGIQVEKKDWATKFRKTKKK
ncbi:bifunctional UDP-N-acetylglucosamine diphosphorylase/glucosamine-1-phosphate N-acetyltransferase GlmU [Microvirga sp. W0021]|uniref:Bifunctional protein GlmU n=1 Tax=Hohaiivirga grylli TaxID=3133970 RepID=A0ABV0BJL1_9HYPH